MHCSGSPPLLFCSGADLFICRQFDTLSLCYYKYCKGKFLMHYLTCKSQPWLVILVLVPQLVINFYFFISLAANIGEKHLFWFKIKWDLTKVVRSGSSKSSYCQTPVWNSTELSVHACEYVRVFFKNIFLPFAPSLCLLLSSGKTKSTWRATECKEAHSQLFLKSWLLPFTTSWS